MTRTGNIPTQMQGLILREGGFSGAKGTSALKSLEPFVTLGTCDIPRPRKGQVLIRVRYASVNPSDIAFIQGVYGQPRVKGNPAGFEGMGEVVASGGGLIGRFMMGRRVAFVARSSGAWATYVVADAAACIPLKKGVRDEDGAAMVVNPLTAAAMLNLVQKRPAKSFVMSAAASQLGKLMTGYGRDLGLRPICIVRRESQVAKLAELGAVHVLVSEQPDFKEKLKSVCSAEKPEIFLDAVTGPVAATIFAAMGMNAQWIIYGRLSEEPSIIPEPGEMIFLKKKIAGFWLVEWFQKTGFISKMKVISRVQDRFANGQWKTDIAQKVALKDAHAAIPKLMKGENPGKILLVPEHD
jgi:NADPH:quinone reductase-like Zn-dependent oxidoreductase